MTENKIYGPGSVFYDFLVNTYYEIVSGKVIKYAGFCDTKSIQLKVQQLKFVKNKIEYVPINNFINRELYEEDHYVLVADNTKEPFKCKDRIYYRDFYKKNSIKKIVSHKPEGDKIEIIREREMV